MRHTRALILACALLGAAPALHAQSSASLRTTTGSPIAYQVGVPKGWTIERSGEFATASSQRAAVVIGARDLLEDTPELRAEERRKMSELLMTSDSLLFGMLKLGFTSGMSDKGTFEQTAQAVRSLGGERAAYLSGWTVTPVGRVRTEIYATSKDGIMYMVMLMAGEDDFAAHEPLFARIRDSFTLPAAPVATPRTIEPPRSTPGRQRDGTWTSR